jgi:hypothetical protein
MVQASKSKGRRRAGELDLRGSEYDSAKRMDLKHCLFYLTILLVTAFFLIDLAV